MVGIVGNSGAGKSTLLNILADFVKPSDCESIHFYNFDLSDPYDRLHSRKYISICP